MVYPHPWNYHYIPTTTFPYISTFRIYNNGVKTYYGVLTFDTDQLAFVTTNSNKSDYWNMGLDLNVGLVFKSKVRSAKLHYWIDGGDSFEFVNYFIYPDDFTVVYELRPEHINQSNWTQMYSISADSPSISYFTTSRYGYNILCYRFYDDSAAYGIKINPHNYATNIDYDFCILWFIHVQYGGHKAVITPNQYHPLGWIDGNRVYRLVLPKDCALYFTGDKGGYRDFGFIKAEFVKLNENINIPTP